MDFEDFVTATNRATTVDELYCLLVEALERFGFDRSLYSFLTSHQTLGLAAGHGIMRNYPDSWMEYYFAKDYFSIDPVVQQCYDSLTPFHWSSLPQDARQSRLMDEAKEAGLLDGIGLPIHGARGEVAGFGLASSSGKVDFTPDTLSLIHAYVFQFHQAYIDTCAKPQQPTIRLSAKESDVLHWMAEGKTLHEIGEIMHLSEDTIRYYLKSLYSKLGANQRTLAVVKAIRLGLLKPSRLGM